MFDFFFGCLTKVKKVGTRRQERKIVVVTIYATIILVIVIVMNSNHEEHQTKRSNKQPLQYRSIKFYGTLERFRH